MIISRSAIFLPFLLTLSTIFYTLSASADTTTRVSREEYIERYKKIAIDHQFRFGIPASITMAQGILESDCGNSTLARGSNNHFGIKCKSDWTGKTFTYTDDAPDECFRAYKSVEDSYEDHAKFLDESPRYDSLFDYRSNDYHSWARGLKAAGYATAPDYAARLVKIIEDNKLYLLDSNDDGIRRVPQQQQNNKATDSKQMTNPNRLTISVYAKGGYDIYKANGSLYVIAAKDDSFDNISMSLGISASKLRQFNDMDKSAQEIAEGSIIYLESKNRKWMGDEAVHQLKAGESIESVSQLYGVRLKSLYRMTKVKVGTELKVGDVINLR